MLITSLLFILLLWWIVSWLWNKRQAGYLLLAFSQSKFVSGTFIVLGISQILVAFTSTSITDTEFEAFAALSSKLLLVISCLFIGLSKTEFKEKGIWYPTGNLLKWEEIESYAWWRKADKDYILVIKLRQPRSNERTVFRSLRQFLSRTNTSNSPLSVPSHHKEAADRILREYLSPATS